MSLSAKYQAFLQNPSAGALADNATLHYISTLVSLHDAAAIMKHFAVQEKLVKKTGEKILGVVEGPNELALDVETTLEFISGGGAYLPGLDDNFVADRIVSFPMVHIVHFDKGQKITQVRLYWDQGSLLKQIDVIGARARNWPIRDGKDQTRLIATNAAAVAQPASVASSRRSTVSRGREEKRPTSSRSATNDPHATLSLFQPRDVNQQSESSYSNRPAAPRATSLKPAPRDYGELFAGAEALPSGGEPTSHKQADVPGKTGGGQNFKPNRLFDRDTEEEEVVATPVSIKTSSKKYDHFDMGIDDDEATPKVRETVASMDKSKHSSQWGFEDFVTPEKPKTKILAQAVRHIGWSDDENETSPVRRPIVHKARPDADPHFQFEDESTPAAQRIKNIPGKGRLQGKAMGLYTDHVTNTTSDDEQDDAPKGTKDNGGQEDTYSSFNDRHQNATEDRKLALKGMDPAWGHYEQSPNQPKKDKENQRSNGIKTSGNGMGGRNDRNRGWGIGDSEDESEKEEQRPAKSSDASTIGHQEIKSTAIKTSGNGMGARSGISRGWGIGASDDESEKEQRRPGKATTVPQQSKTEIKNTAIKTSGNGMGARTGTSRGWGIGDSDDEADEVQHKPSKAPTEGHKGFWDF